MVNALEQEVDAIADPGQDGVGIEKLVEGVAVQHEDFAPAAMQDELLHDRRAQQVRYELGRSVVIATNPDNLHPVGQLADQRQYFPMVFLQPPEINRVENI